MPMDKGKIFVSFILFISVSGSLGADPCSPSPCGSNTNCQSVSGRAVCSCLPGHYGSPLVSCIKGECTESTDCPKHKTCIKFYCKDVCEGSCGVNAKCNAQNHIPVCSCPPGYSGNPFVECHRYDPEELCKPSPCGKNTKCRVVNNVPICSCLPGYEGSALRGCTPECETDAECSGHQQCSNLRCVSVCSTGVCGTEALCTAKNHVAICSCPEGYVGNPQLSCRPECTVNQDCGVGGPVCWYGRCIDPCKSACGQNANCRVRGNTAICSCPKGFTGNPMEFCRPFNDDDYCNPNPCGENAVCRPGFDDTGKRRPVCTCPPGYVGDALRSCRRGECVTDVDCGPENACDPVRFECQHVCRGACGAGAECVARNHVALCACPAGYTGDASISCRPLLARERFLY